MRDKRIKELGFNIKVERLRQKMSQLKLSEHVGVCMETIQKIEGGRQTPSALVMYDIAKTLDVPMETFFKDLPDKEI